MNYQFALPERSHRHRHHHHNHRQQQQQQQQQQHEHQHHNRHRRFYVPKCSLFMTPIAVAVALAVLLAFIEPAAGQQNLVLNTPPVLYVSERNWRIDENEPVGQIISRIRAEDSENEKLVFGLEPNFHPNYANPNDDEEVKQKHLPFRIDPNEGIVYLNESLVGRAGENFFFYITVFDGQLTAKNEVFVNILSKRDKKQGGLRGGGSNGGSAGTFSNAVKNLTQFLPSFDQLPGVQSIRNQHPSNRNPFNSLPPGFGINSNGAAVYPPLLNFNLPPNPQVPPWLTGGGSDNKDGDEHDKDLESEEHQITTQTQTPTATVVMETPKTLMPTTATDTATTTSRTKLTPISSGGSSVSGSDSSKTYDPTIKLNNNKHKNSTTPILGGDVGGSDSGSGSGGDGDSTTTTTTTIAYSIKATMIPVIIAVCGLFVAGVLIFGFLYRKRLCAISKTLKKKSKEEMAKKSNQSNLSSNLTDDSHNSMVLQHWNGPTAYGNRYVPWERDQQTGMFQYAQQATTPTSTSAPNSDAAVANGAEGGGGGGAGGIGIVGGGMMGIGNHQGKKDRWEFPRHRLKFFNILGEGAFGQVWRCEATDIDGIEGITTVAVKTLKENSSEIDKKDLLSELEVMKSLAPHVNVVRFLGCCTDKDPIFVIIEYVNRGKLQTYLRNSRAERHYGNTHGKSNILTSGDLTSFMYQVAKGMDYLTSRGIIHRDLAARNILITDDHTCKIADFGFARDVITSKIYERKSEGKLPIRWMAIESLYDNLFSVKSDIWSFGILMWEIVTLGSTPYPGISAADVMKKVRDGYRLEKPEHCRRELYNIMYYCWSSNANERPTFSEVVQMLDKLLHTEMDYIELERFPDHNYYNIVNPSGEKV